MKWCGRMMKDTIVAAVAAAAGAVQAVRHVFLGGSLRW